MVTLYGNGSCNGVCELDFFFFFFAVITAFCCFLCASISVSCSNYVSKMWPLYENQWMNLATDLHWNCSQNIVLD